MKKRENKISHFVLQKIPQFLAKTTFLARGHTISISSRLAMNCFMSMQIAGYGQFISRVDTFLKSLYLRAIFLGSWDAAYTSISTWKCSFRLSVVFVSRILFIKLVNRT